MVVLHHRGDAVSAGDRTPVRRRQEGRRKGAVAETVKSDSGSGLDGSGEGLKMSQTYSSAGRVTRMPSLWSTAHIQNRKLKLKVREYEDKEQPPEVRVRTSQNFSKQQSKVFHCGESRK